MAYIIVTKKGGRYAGIEAIEEEKIGGSVFYAFQATAKRGKIRQCKVAVDQVSEIVEYEKNENPE